MATAVPCAVSRLRVPMNAQRMTRRRGTPRVAGRAEEDRSDIASSPNVARTTALHRLDGQPTAMRDTALSGKARRPEAIALCIASHGKPAWGSHTVDVVGRG